MHQPAILDVAAQPKQEAQKDDDPSGEGMNNCPIKWGLGGAHLSFRLRRHVGWEVNLMGFGTQ